MEVQNEDSHIKYLLKKLPRNLHSSKIDNITKIFFPYNQQNPRFNIEIKNEVTFLNFTNNKKNSIETKIELSREEYESFLHIPGKRIQKKIYEFETEKHETILVNVYEMNLSGLIIAEINNNSNLTKIDFLLTQIKEEDKKFFCDSNLCNYTYIDIEEKLLKEYNYKKLIDPNSEISYMDNIIKEGEKKEREKEEKNKKTKIKKII